MTHPDSESRTLKELTKIAEGAEAEIFAWGEGTVLRLHRNPGASEIVRREAAALAAAAAAGVRVPAVYREVTVEGRPGLIMERIEGPDLLADVGRKPWTIWAIGRQLAELHGTIHDASGADLPSLRETVLAAVPGEVDALRRPFLEAGQALLGELPDGDCLYHGDFHPGNVMAQRGEPVVIDWGMARAPAEADVARTLVLFDVAVLPPGTPLHVRLLAKVLRGLLRRRYLSCYRQRRALDMEALDGWYTVQAFLRLGEIPEETERVQRLVRSRLG